MTGTAKECADLVALLGDLATAGVLGSLGEVSRPYPNRPPSTRVRVYLDLALPSSTTDEAGRGGRPAGR